MRGVFNQDSARNVPNYYSVYLGSTNNSFIVSLENKLLDVHRRNSPHCKIDQQQVHIRIEENSLHRYHYQQALHHQHLLQ